MYDPRSDRNVLVSVPERYRSEEISLSRYEKTKSSLKYRENNVFAWVKFIIS